MDKKKRSMPNNLAMGRGIYPIIPYRSRRTVAGTGAAVTIVSDVIDFDLQFEDNEVMDIIGVESDLLITDLELPDDLGDAEMELSLAVWLNENPEDTTTDMLGAVGTSDNGTSNFVTSSNLVWYHESQFFVGTNQEGSPTSELAVIDKLKDRQVYMFPQPYTVARNVVIVKKGVIEGTTTILQAWRNNFTIWGRRRKANDAEFKNIIYRQRF